MRKLDQEHRHSQLGLIWLYWGHNRYSLGPQMYRMLLDIPESYPTERLIVRAYRDGDGPMYWEMAQRNRDHLFPFEAHNPVRSLQSEYEAENLVREFAAKWEFRQQFFLGAFDRQDGAFAAQIYIGATNWDVGEFIVGYFVDVDHEGMGYVTEAVKGALAFIFEHLQAQRVILHCSDANPRSAQVARRCGFVEEGHLRQNITMANGQRCGEFYFGLLREEYLQQQI